MPRLIAVLVATLLTVSIAHPVRAQGDPDAARGIIAEHCTTCHEVPGFPMHGNSAALVGPPFQSIADQPTVYTRDKITEFLRQPHYPMTKFVLSSSDIDNLVAFIESLRGE
jgi:mono/diheme cytochrome c family protein